jgi:hypothetical protein
VFLGPSGYLDDQECSWVLYKIADGTETGTFTIGITQSRELTAIVARITGHHPYVLPYMGRTYIQTGSTAPDPPSVTHPLGDEDYLWIAAQSNFGQAVTAYPSGYSNGTQIDGTQTNVAIADKTSTSATEDPGAFTIAGSQEWQAFTIGIYPATGADPFNGYPVPVDHVVTVLPAAAGDHAINYPATVDSGDLLVAVVGANINPTFTVAGWTTLASDIADDTIIIVYKVADGTEGGTTFNVNTSGTAVEVTGHVWRITDGGTPQAAIDNTNTTPTMGPPALDMGSSAAHLWIVGACVPATPATWMDTVPSSYFNAIQSMRPNDNNSFNFSTFERVATAQVETPGTFQNPAYSGSDSALAFTIGVPFAASVPSAPTNPAATAVSASQIDVSWDDVSDETGYRVERSPNGTSGWVDVSGNLAAGTTSYQDTGLTASTQYFYRVIAFNGVGDSTPSSVVSATTQAAPATGTSVLPSSLTRRLIRRRNGGSR